MAAKTWRERLTYTAMSFFVAWHTLAMVVAPAPGYSDLMRGLRTVFEPYLHFFELDNDWNFFAPVIGKDSILRYVITDDSGKDHSFDSVAGLNWFSPSSIWFRSWYAAVLDSPDDFAAEFAALLCRQHVDLHPVAIRLSKVE